MDPTPADVQALADSIAQWKTATVVIVFGSTTVIVAILAAFRFLDRRDSRRSTIASEAAKAKRSDALTHALGKLTNTASSLNATATEQTAQFARMAETNSELADAVRTQVALARGALPPTQSRWLIEREMDVLCKDVAYGFIVSLKANHYRDYEREIHDKMCREVARMIDRMVAQLQRFDLSVELSAYVETSEDGKRYPLVERIWKSMVKFYMNPVDYRDSHRASERNREVRQTLLALFRDEIKDGHARADRLAFQLPEHTPTASAALSDSRRHKSSPALIPPSSLTDEDSDGGSDRRASASFPIDPPTDRIEAP